MARHQVQLKAILDARNDAVLADARNIIVTGIQRPLRNGAAVLPKENDTVSVYQKLNREPRPRWHHGYRAMAHSGRHGIVERSNRMFKIPLYQTRKDGKSCATNVDEEQTSGSETQKSTDDTGQDSGSEKQKRGRFGELISRGKSSSSHRKSPAGAILPLTMHDDVEQELIVTVDHGTQEEVEPIQTYRDATNLVHGVSEQQMSDICSLQEYLAVNSFDDVLDEWSNQQVASLGYLGNQCEWRVWGANEITHSINVSNAKPLEDVLGDEALAGHDLNRITPKWFLKVKAARDALVRELVGLTKPGKDGFPAMEIANGYDAKYKGLKKNYPMVVMRKKDTGYL